MVKLMDDLGFKEEPFERLRSNSLRYNLDMLRGKLEGVGLIPRPPAEATHSDL
jgi:hypothetical protein